MRQRPPTKLTTKFTSRLSRRSMLSGIGALGASAVLASTAHGQETIWEQLARNRILRETNSGGNTSTALDTIDTIEPILSLDTAYNLELAIRQYEELVAAGGWPAITTDVFRLAAGNRRTGVKELKRRLIASGDVAADTRVNDTFDSNLDVGVRSFQARHGLVIDGQVGEQTFYALEVPAEYRLNQLRLNALRVGTLAASLAEKYVLVNIPAAVIEAVEGSTVDQRHTAIVGRIDRQTPILSSRIHEINFNPYWHVPKSIIRRDLIRYMNDDPEYLTNYRIHIFDNSGQELSATDIDWSTDDAVQYSFRQEPGAENSMGHVKINFHNEHAVYLHDTPAKSLFGENRRFHSSGCVRVENVDAFVAWILRNNGGWDQPTVNAVFGSGERLDVAVGNPVPILTTYVTAWANRQGTISFRDDVYEFDAQGRVTFS